MDKLVQDSNWVGVAEVSEKLGLSLKTVRKHIASGKLESIKNGGVYKVSSNSLQQFIENAFT